MIENYYDLIIIGMGPAGYTASIYASRYKIKNLLIGNLPGGLIGQSHKVCNFPTEEEISGLDLAMKMHKKAASLGADQKSDEVTDIQKIKEKEFKITTRSGKEFLAKSVLLATGLKHRKLNITGEEEFIGKGVAYCATCDAFFFKNKTVAVIGGGDAANSASAYLSEIAKKVYQIYRGSELRGETAWIEMVKNNPKIEVIYNTNVVEFGGNNNLEYLILDKEYHGQNKLLLDGAFIEIGAEPDHSLISRLNLKTDEKGYLVVDRDQSTNIRGVYGAGDVTVSSNGFKQVITACSEGAIAAEAIFKYLKS